MNQVENLNGLVLAGGRGRRMGTDKGMMGWHGKEQRYHMADVLAPLCSQVYISCRPEQLSGIGSRYQPLADTCAGGPAGGILTAFQHNPACAWLVTACDLPLLDAATLQYLIQNRDPAAVATAFSSPYDGLPEPLITIWEPAGYPLLLSFFEKGITCPRKVLLNSNTNLLPPIYPEALLNANTPADAEKVNQILRERSMKAHAS